MKKGLHPSYQECTVTCTCGNTIVTKSTKPSYFVEVCSNCSSAYTGKKSNTSRSSKVERFNEKYKNIAK